MTPTVIDSLKSTQPRMNACAPKLIQCHFKTPARARAEQGRAAVMYGVAGPLPRTVIKGLAYHK